MLNNVLQSIGILLQYWMCLAQFVFGKKSYSECVLFPHDQHARVQIFSLSLIFRLWSEPHYRSKSFQQDLLDNLKNVAVPGTGIALSWFCYSKLTAMFFVFLLNPFICFCGAINQALHQRTTDSLDELFQLVESNFTRNLLHPDDWFSLWRMNCRLVSYHSWITGSTDYKMEDKWTFLVAGKELNVPISPYDDTTESLVCKNKLIEGGMGIHFYRNAAFGGDWILQERLQNAAWLNALLPSNAPLSTMRVITTSSFTLSAEYPLKQSRDLLNKSTQQDDDIDHISSTLPTATTLNEDNEQITRYIRAESAVLRLGRMHANTDHSSILFDVDIATGVIQGGTSNAHWYQLGGLSAVMNTPWLPPAKRMRQHIDPPFPVVSGQLVPNMQEALEIVTKAHYAMMPEVPIVGWDVAFTTKGIFLLEVNLSCNFFRGSFNLPRYIDLIHQYWLQLEKMEQLNADFQENHSSSQDSDASTKSSNAEKNISHIASMKSANSLAEPTSTVTNTIATSTSTSAKKLTSPHRHSHMTSLSLSNHVSQDQLTLGLPSLALGAAAETTNTSGAAVIVETTEQDQPQIVVGGDAILSEENLQIDTPRLPPQNPAQTIKYKRHSFPQESSSS